MLLVIFLGCAIGGDESTLQPRVDGWTSFTCAELHESPLDIPAPVPAQVWTKSVNHGGGNYGWELSLEPNLTYDEGEGLTVRVPQGTDCLVFVAGNY